MLTADMPAGKKLIGRPPIEPNIVVDISLKNQTVEDQIKKFVGPMKILAPGPSPLEGLGPVGIGMDRDAPPMQAEIITMLEHRDGYHYHRYDVHTIHAPFSCCWKGYYGEFTATNGDAEDLVMVSYRGHMDPYPCCPCCPCVLASCIKLAMSGKAPKRSQ